MPPEDLAALRNLPSVERLLRHPALAGLLERYRRDIVVDAARRRVAEARESARKGATTPTLDEVAGDVARQVLALTAPWPKPLINATGVVLHTNLGRAPLSRAAIEAMAQAAAGYTDLEFDVEPGERGSRQARLQPLLTRLTGAEAGLAVNNNASAVLLGLMTLAQGREVIVSRGEAVEIGGGFRVPDVLRQSGATLVEVGTTNRTYTRDYADAITERTAALLKVHASNFRVVGFTHEPSLEELVEAGHARGVPVLYDLGSGCLLPTERFGLAHEPMPQEAVAAGVDLVFFSGDKLLGGPQAGIVAGRAELVKRLERHPLARAIRCDKATLAALVATLAHYARDEATREVPVWRMLSATPDALRPRAEAYARAAGKYGSVVEAQSAIGGGSLPGETLPTWAAAVRVGGESGAANALARHLRENDPPVIARVESDAALLDPRTVRPEEDPTVCEAVRKAVGAA